MLRDLLVRVAAGLLCGAIAISCSHDDKPTEPVASIEQAASLAGAGGLGSGGAPDLAGAPGAGGAPASCDPVTCAAQGDCMHCNGTVCEAYTAGDAHECNAKNGECDVAEVCLGGATCPKDDVEPPGTTCGNAPAGICDKADTCDGTAKTCTDMKQDGNFVCNAKNGACDVAELCQGGDTCPKDDVLPQGATCGNAVAGTCDKADTCDGTAKTCTDKKQDSTVVCRPIKANSTCDLAEKCDGTNDDCPSDKFKLDTVVCRAKLGDCDVDDKCTGNGPDCPGDGKAADGSGCANNANKCLSVGTTTCKAGVCDQGTPIVCPTPANVCLAAGSCVPATGVCVPTPQPPTTACSDNIACTQGDHCNAGACVPGAAVDSACQPHQCASVTCDPTASPADGCKVVPIAAGTQCRGVKAGEICDVAEACDGTSPDCPDDKVKAQGTQCLAASCTNFQSQVELTCDGTLQNKKCAAASPVSCNGYACDGALCKQDCASDDGCQPTHYCVNNTCELRIGAGEACTDDTQCSKSNAHCVDGVCCNTTCTGQCEACDVKAKEGTCSVVTGDPHGARTACRGDGSACNGSCAGKLRSACDFPSPQTVCLEAACDPKTSTAVEQAFCNGAGNCATTEPMDCTPFTCGATACRGNCVTDAQCATGAYCKAGICEDLQKPGSKCARDGQCASAFCTDGVCCEGRCDGQCESCGSGGKCQPVTGAPVGMRPACAGADGDACAGVCDGTVRSSCGYPGGEIVCRDAECDAGKATVVAHCSGAGACAPEQTVTCENGCEGAICAGDACLVNSDCKDGERCIAGTCAAQGENGASCAAAGDCGSGFCVDGVCCDKACDGQCEACDGAKKPGVCAPVSGAPHGARVPCTTDGSACAGACDGQQPLGCSYPSGTVCNPGSCTPGQDGNEAVATVEASCNGSGRCPAPREQACGGDGCDAQKQLCNGDCADGSACPSGQYCSAGECVTSLPSGTACQSASECASGFCVDGYCCGSACDDRCAACDVPGALGQCSPVAGNTHGGRPACRGGGVCGAQCDGDNVTDCAFADDKTTCGTAYCNSGTQVAASTCDGAGQCRAGEATACASFSCDATDCADACNSDSDCTRDLQCHDGKCVEKFKINAVDQGTCGCRVPGGPASSTGTHGVWLTLAALGLLPLRRRRARGGANEALH